MNRDTSAAAEAPEGLPATLAGFEDQASFFLFLNEEKLGRFWSTWKLDGSVESHSSISLAGQTLQTSTTIAPDADGRWRKIVIESRAVVQTITRRDTAVTHVWKRAREKTTTFATAKGAVLYDDGSPVLISQALRLYDPGKGGVQRLPVMIGAGPPVELAVEAGARAVRQVGGREMTLTRFLYGLPGADLHAWADETGKVYLVEAPAQNAVMVREGCEALRLAEGVERLLSGPEHEVVMERDVHVPMRDGIELATDIYRPLGLDKAPILLARSPYKKELSELQARFYCRRGYIYAAQDCRGRFSSPGSWEPFMNEGRDGHDTIEWLARQPYSNGKIGMIGVSYVASAHWLAAAQRPPHLVTMIASVSPPDPFHNLPYEYGVFLLWSSIWWLAVLESQATADVSGAVLRDITEKRYTELLRTLPVVDLDKAVLGKESSSWRRWIEHPAADGYWDEADFLDRLENVDIPVFHQSGWFDGDGIGTKLNYLKMVSHRHPYQKMILGPWGHTGTAERLVGSRDFGENAIVDLQREYLRWFDHWLKGVDNGIDREPLVSVFVMGTNRWLHGATYPLAGTRAQALYLTSQGLANTSKGDGKLTFDPPAADSPPDHYTYDPGDPTPAPDAYQESAEDEQRIRPAEDRRKAAQEYRREVPERRQDILVYATDALATRLTFVGPISAVIYASSSAPDTDWFVTLSEEERNGEIFQLVRGKMRARFRKSTRSPELLEPNEIHVYVIDLWHTAISIPAGSRLRVEVASAAFPLFSRNLNTGGHNEAETHHVAAQQAIYHDRRHPSHILLPIISRQQPTWRHARQDPKESNEQEPRRIS